MTHEFASPSPRADRPVKVHVRTACALGALVLALVSATYVSLGLEWRDLWPRWGALPDMMDRERTKALRALQTRNPVQDADAAIAGGDFRLRALGGYTSWIPAPSPVFEWVNRWCPALMTPGTASDFITLVPNHLSGVDADYAVAYNARVLGRVPWDAVCGPEKLKGIEEEIREAEGQLKAMMAADPLVEAEKRLASGDHRLIAVRNDGGIFVPGVENASGWRALVLCRTFLVGHLRTVDSTWAAESRRWAEAENRLATFVVEAYGPLFNRRMLQGLPRWRLCLPREQYDTARRQRELRGEWWEW